MSLHPVAAHFHGHYKIVLNKITRETSDKILHVIFFWQSYYQPALTIWLLSNHFVWHTHFIHQMWLSVIHYLFIYLFIIHSLTHLFVCLFTVFNYLLIYYQLGNFLLWNQMTLPPSGPGNFFKNHQTD